MATNVQNNGTTKRHRAPLLAAGNWLLALAGYLLASLLLSNIDNDEKPVHCVFGDLVPFDMNKQVALQIHSVEGTSLNRAWLLFVV